MPKLVYELVIVLRGRNTVYSPRESRVTVSFSMLYSGIQNSTFLNVKLRNVVRHSLVIMIFLLGW